MNHKEIIKYFYEVVVSENLLDELPQYISENCVQNITPQQRSLIKLLHGIIASTPAGSFL